MSLEQRQLNILSVVDNFLQTRQEWVNSDAHLITEKFEDAVLLMLDTCHQGDVPASCRQLLAAVHNFGTEWETFEIEATQDEPHPRNSFWTAVEQIERARATAVRVPRPPLETVAVLRKQKVSDNQIARQIYGYKGEGPFLSNGGVRSDLIDLEESKPGSVIPADWIHPIVANQMQKEMELDQLVRSKMATKSTGPKPAPETYEQLLKEQRVSIPQVAKMKMVSIEEVTEEAKKLGLLEEKKSAGRPKKE